MKKAIFFICLFLTGFALQAQKFLAYDRPHARRIYFYPGDDIKMKMIGETGFTARTLYSVNDSGFVVDGKHFVSSEMVSHIKIYRNKKRRVLKSLLLYGGIMLPLVSGINGVINKNSPVFATWSLIYGAASLSAYATLMAIDHAGTVHKVTKERPLKSIILDMKEP